MPPGIFVILFFAVTFYSVRKKFFGAAIFSGTVTLIFWLLCTGFFAEKFVGSFEREFLPPEKIEESGADIIIVLGGGAGANIPDVDGQGALYSSSAYRILTAARLHKKLNLPVLVSGGKVYEDSGDEAKIFAEVLKSLGVPDEKIFVEPESLTTTQNAIYSAEILREKNFRKPILVTSAFHIKRAVENFSRQNVEVIPFPTDYMTPGETKFNLMKLCPDAGALWLNVIFIRENFRLFVMNFFGI